MRAGAGARGLVPGPPRAYLAGKMSFFGRFNPLRAVSDLRRFLGSRPRYEIYTLFGAAAVTWTIMWAFVIDTQDIKVPYKRNIIYVESWPLDRSDEEILAKQKIDQVKIDKERAELEKKQKERQAMFKKWDDWFKSWGM